MQQLAKLFLILSSTLLVSSCVETVDDVDISGEGEKLVLTSFITPDADTIYANLSQSTPYFDDNNQSSNINPQIKNATLNLSNGKSAYSMKYDSTNNNFHLLTDSSFKIKTGHTYTIKAKAPGFENVKSECTVPYSAPNDIKLIDKYTTHGNFNNDLIGLVFEFKDIPSEENFYRLSFFEKEANLNNDSSWQQNDHYWKFNKNTYVLSDDKRDGQNIKVRAEMNDFSGQKDIRIMLLSVDEHYYNYHDKLNRFGSGNPFSEPVILYSNIKNGLGVFSGYTKTIKDFTITCPIWL